MMDRPNRCGRLLVAATILAALLGGVAVSAAMATSPRFGRDLRNRLDRPVDAVLWSATPLRTVLDDLSETQNVAIWLDRRADPDQRVSLAPGDVPLKDVLARLAREHALGISLFRSVVYLGPKTTTGRLRTLGALRREEARKLPSDAAKKWFRTESMRWEEPAAPRELLARLARENRLEIEGLDRVVHDLWPTVELPPMTLADRLTLILAPLELTYQFEGRGSRIRLVPIPDRVVLTKRYPAGIRPESTIQRWAEIIPEAKIGLKNGQIVVQGRLEDHERLKSPKRRSSRPDVKDQKKDSPAIERLSIKEVAFKNQPLEAIVRQMASRLRLKLRFDAKALRRSGIDLDRRISLDLKNVTVDELFRAILEPSGLTFHREGSVLEIHAKRP